MSRRLLVVVEGQTEHAVLNSLVSPHLGAQGIYLYPKVVGRPGRKGGVPRAFDSVAKEVLNLFKQEPSAAVSTFFDFYGMPDDWPGLALARQRKLAGLGAHDVAAIVEQAWRRELALWTAKLDRPVTFIPYVQMHELEALLFADTKSMADAFLKPELASRLQAIVADCGGCEEINDQPNSAPSKRIQQIFPSYRKGRDSGGPEDRRPHAAVIAARTGLAAIRLACPHFDYWLRNLEALAVSPEAS